MSSTTAWLARAPAARARWLAILVTGALPLAAALVLGSLARPGPVVLALLAGAAGVLSLGMLARRVGVAGAWLLGVPASILLGQLAAVGAGGQSGRILVTDALLMGGIGVAVARAGGRIEVPRAAFLATLVPLIAWGALGLLVARDPLTGLAELKEWAIALLAGATAWTWAARDPRRARVLVAGIVWTAVMIALAMLAVMMRHPAGPVFAVMMKLVDLPWGRSNYLAGFLILALPLALGFVIRAHGLARRLAWGAALALCALGLALSASKGALLALALSAPLAFAAAGRAARRVALLGIAVLAAIVLTFVNGPLRQVLDFRLGAAALDFSMNERLALYQLAWESFLSHPLLGLGLNNFSVASHALRGVDTVPHNLELGVLAELGAPGLVWVLVWIGAIAIAARRACAAARTPGDRVFAAGVVAAWLGCLLHNQVESTIYGAQFKIVLMILAAATCALGHTTFERPVIETPPRRSGGLALR